MPARITTLKEFCWGKYQCGGWGKRRTYFQASATITPTFHPEGWKYNLANAISGAFLNWGRGCGVWRMTTKKLTFTSCNAVVQVALNPPRSGYMDGWDTTGQIGCHRTKADMYTNQEQLGRLHSIQ
ncbi:hypothetical protein B0H13DRAFT_1861621 [Mycena leptocephala]|nr:hypothetical protein B0H13DRAFT_1861621 [Mycena leptocephala]